MKASKYLLVLIAAIQLTACGGGENDTKTEEQTKTKTTANGTTIAADRNLYVSPLPSNAPTYKIAMINYTPFHFRNEYGDDVGYDVDLIRAVGEEMGFKVKIHTVPFNQLFSAIKAKKYDLAMSGLSLTDKRKAVMQPSQPYSKGKPGYLIESSSVYRDVESLADKTISVLNNSSLHQILNKQGTASILPTKTMFLSFQAIFTDKSDAAFGMEPVLFYESKQFSEHPVEFIPYADPIFTVAYTNIDTKEIIDKVNQGFDKIHANGRYDKINKKWFGENVKNIAIK